ncbi:3-oxoadipate enol-lactone hydrolase [Longimonas halophila]|uniref:3-oxoadipate enol-lactone hydrolase n=2 Tax=Longimonas halophila TaxID=1469170 RepID=A0A2H3PA38_9BACT|nr:3-oxoadipate enol-lactone hydrolase [Longimonas halophila]
MPNCHMPTLAVDDIALHYTDTERDAPPLVFVHGLGSSGRDWAPQVEALASDFRVLTCDLRGHGHTSTPEGPYSIAQMARDVAVWLRKIDAAPAHVVGLSMGGMVTYELLAHTPEVVRSGTIINSVPGVQLNGLGDYAFYWSRRGAVQALGMRRVGRLLARKLFIKADQQELRTQFIERWATNDKQAYLASIDGLVGWSVEDRLPAIQHPVLVLAADDDYTPASAKQQHAHAMPNAQLAVVADARHALPVERPDAVNALLRAFIERVEQQKSRP